MRLLILIQLILGLFMGALYAQEMIADITDPVETEFGTYIPRPVSVTPSVKPYSISVPFTDIVNLGYIPLHQNERDKLLENYFVVTPARPIGAYGNTTGYKEMWDIYTECREEGIPIFVTTDAMLHTFHLCFDYILKTCEEKRFFGDLNDLLNGLLDRTVAQYQAATENSVQEAVLRNLDYLVVAKTLLDSTYEPTIHGGKYLDELALIKAQEMEYSPLFGYDEDYNQYIPRGHYTRSDSLRHYFLSMMWLGRMTFAADPIPFYASLNRLHTRSAILLVQVMENLIVNERTAFEVWENIYQPTIFFVGKSDDINFYQYRQIGRQVYGDNFADRPADDFADEDLLSAFLDQALALPGPRITASQPQGFRFMGQRFIPDSWILDELVFDKVASRLWPTGLDVMIVLGSERAREHLCEQDKNDPSYLVKLDTLVNIFDNYPNEIWAQNAYWNWLYSLMPLLFPKGEGYPPFMQSLAWLDKDLYAALASWAELRHDTILYAKQSGTETSVPPASIEMQGYVEPNPYFYARLASLADYMIAGLDSRDLLHPFPKFVKSLGDLRDLLIILQEISEKELANQSLTAEEYEVIFTIGKKIQDIAEFNLYPGNGPLPDSEEMPVVADVHTEKNSEKVLEVGVGYPYAIYVICPIEGQLVVTKGAGLSYYEFKWPMTDRLTDEKWRQILQSEEPQQPPSWIESFFVSDNILTNTDPQFRLWSKPGEISVSAITIEPENPQVGDQATVRFTIPGFFEELLPWVMVSTAGGQELGPFNATKEGHYDWKATFNTMGMESGQAWVEIQANWGPSEKLNYRNGFHLDPFTGVEDDNKLVPAEYQLYPNMPNPFNPSTQIRFDLPVRNLVKLEIFDLLGRKVRTLISEERAAGSFVLRWNGRDDSGQMLGSGVYFCRIRAGDFVDVKRMVLLR